MNLPRVGVERCQCGQHGCNRFGLDFGMFYQGCGWDEDEAREIAKRINAFESLVRRYGDALLYIESYGGEVTASYAAAGNLEEHKRFLASLEENTA